MWSKAGHYNEALIDSVTGNPITLGNYFVYLPDGETLASIYTDVTRGVIRNQPLVTSSDGDAEFYADPGSYVLTAAASSKNIDVMPSVDDLGTLLTALQSISDNALNAHILKGYRNQEVEYTDTTYTYSTATDLSATVLLNNPSPISGVLPATAQPGEGFPWVQKGAGQITWSVASGGGLKNAHSHTKSFGQDAIGYLECTSNSDGNSAIWHLTGDTAA